MITIHLHELKFTGFHGVYEEEKILGNEYIINVSVQSDIKDHVTHLHETTNYVTLYEIIKKRMAQPSALLETVVQDLAVLIHESDNRVKSVDISIKKMNPPIMNFQGSVGVSYRKEF